MFPSDFHAHCETLVFVGCTRPTIVEPILLLKDCTIQEAVTSVHDDCALSNHEQHFSHGSLLFFQGMVSAQLFPTENDEKEPNMYITPISSGTWTTLHQRSPKHQSSGCQALACHFPSPSTPSSWSCPQGLTFLTIICV